MTDAPALFVVRFTCCGHDDGSWPCSSWEQADALRESYISAEGHDRTAIIEGPTP